MCLASSLVVPPLTYSLPVLFGHRKPEGVGGGVEGVFL